MKSNKIVILSAIISFIVSMIIFILIMCYYNIKIDIIIKSLIFISIMSIALYFPYHIGEKKKNWLMNPSK